MANSGPGRVTITSTTGPGVVATAQAFADVASITIDFMRNVVAINRTGSGSTVYYDYSAAAAIVTAIAAGATSITIT